MYKNVFWEISGVCNSQCCYCPNGGKSILGDAHKRQAGFLSTKAFEDGLRFLLEKKLISPVETQVDLYDWGEPFLHPQFEAMLEIVTNMGFVISLSTNGSILKMIPPNTYWRLKSLSFSMPGFSQESYDRIHGFNFKTICENIKAISKPIQILSPNTGIFITFHLYKFNTLEIDRAIEFCKELNIGFTSWRACLTGITMPRLFSKDADIRNELFPKDKELEQEYPQEWICPQYQILVLDEYCNVLQCCLTERFVSGHIIGTLKEVDFDILPELRSKAPICSLCRESKICYLIGT